MSSSPFSPGHHQFYSASKNLTFTYSVHCRSTASPHKTLIIQCPAWGLGPSYLEDGLRALHTTHGYTCIFFHPRGTDGSTAGPPDRMSSMPCLASDLEDLRDHLGMPQFWGLLGHSNGGAIALGYAEMYPERVHKLLLLSHQLVGFEDAADVETLQQDARYREALQAARQQREEPGDDTDERFTRTVDASWPVYFHDPRRYVGELRRAIGGRVLSRELYRRVYSCDGRPEAGEMVDRLGEVQAKTLMIVGASDWRCGPRVAERTRKGIPDAQLLVYEDCGHFPWIEQRQRTLRDIVGFLEAS